MKLSEVRVKNYRSFESFQITLHEQVTLLVGVNASGKTAILDAIAVALGAWLKGTSEARLEDRPIHSSDARLVREETQGLALATPHFPVEVSASGEVMGAHLEWTRELRSAGGKTTTAGAKSVRQAAATSEQRLQTEPNHPLPLLAYYGTSRLWVQRRNTVPKAIGSRFQGYIACLERAQNQPLLERWMAWREESRIQQIAKAVEQNLPLDQVVTSHLNAVSKAAESCLSGARRFFYSANHRELQVEFEDGSILPYRMLSDGQRGIIAIVADLAWRAAQLNPHHGEDAPAKTDGVVLIDEVELHLHPSWQRTMIQKLITVFPKVQFVLTTHSPQVVSTAKPQWLRVLTPQGEVARVPHTFGKDSNGLLVEVMGVSERPEEMLHQLARLEELIEEGQLKKARSLFNALLLDLGDNDPSLIPLEWELCDKESDEED